MPSSRLPSGRRKAPRMLLAAASALAVFCLASTVHGNQPGPVKQLAAGLQPPSPNPANVRPARRAANAQPDPFDVHLDRLFANFDEKNGKDDSLWDRLKRNFVDESDGKRDQLARRSWWKEEGTLIKPKWLAKIYEAAIVGGKAIVKVINKEYPTHYLINRVDVALDIVDRVPYYLDRLIPIFDTADALPFYLGNLVELAESARPVWKLLPRAERLLHQIEQIDINGLVYNGNQLLHRVQKLPLERMVELLFNLSAEFKSITDLVKQAQALIPSLLPLFLGRGGQSSSSSSSAAASSTGTTTARPSDSDSIVFFPPLDDEEEEAGGSSGKETNGGKKSGVMMLVQFPPLDPASTTGKPSTASTTTRRPASSSSSAGGGLASLDPAFIAKLKPQVIQNINPAILGVLTPELVAEIDADYLNALEPKVLKNLQPELLSKVDPKLLRSIPASLLNALPEELIKDFKPEFLEGLDPTFFQNLDPALLEGLDADTIRAFLMPDSNRRVFAVYPVDASRMKRRRTG